MAPRPHGLPDFRSPPVTEVVIGVQFNSLRGFLTPHLGLVWEKFKDNFPHLEEQMPLPPAFETFGAGLRPITAQFNFFGGEQMPRVFFINEN